MRSTRVASVLFVVLASVVGHSSGQTVINVPPSPSPSSAGADTVVNVLVGGSLLNNFQVLNGGELNIQGGSAEAFRALNGGFGSIYDGTVYRAIAGEGGTVNVFGGEIRWLNAENDGVLNIHGGTLIDGLDTNDAIVNIWGGAFTDNFRARVDSELTVYASEFRLNGNLVTGLVNPGDSVTIPITPIAHDYLTRSDYLSGVFENGLPFILGGEYEPFVESVKLVLTGPYTPSPSLIQVPTDPAPQGIHSGQTLVLDTGGTLPRNFTASNGSTMLIQGGTIGPNFEAIGAQVDVTGGQMDTIDAFAGTVFNISSGAQWRGATVYQGSVVNINGGAGGGGFEVLKGGTANLNASDMNGFFTVDEGTVNITGGSIDAYRQESKASNHSAVNISDGRIGELIAGGGSTVTMTGGAATAITVISDKRDDRTRVNMSGGWVERLNIYDDADGIITGGSIDAPDNLGGITNLYGGAIGDGIEWLSGTVRIHGYNFQVDGVPIDGLNAVGNSKAFNYTPGTTFSGTLSDGTPFNFFLGEALQAASIENGVVRLIRSEVPTLPNLIEVSTDSAPNGISSGQTLIMRDGGELSNNFIAGPGSNVEIHGGTVGYNLEADRSQVTISGGSVGDRWDVFKDATITVTGGILGKEFEVYAGGTLNIQGGVVGSSGDIRGGTVNISGGEVGFGLEALEGSVVNVSGGRIASGFIVQNGAAANISGGEIDHNFEINNGGIAVVSGGYLSELDVKSGGQAQVSGGNINDLNTASSSSAAITGGSFGDGFSISGTSVSELHGLDFKVDGVPVAGLETPGSEASFTMTNNSLFTGTLADGTPFAFRSTENDSISNLKLVRVTELPAPAPVVEISSDSTLGGVRAGQTLTLLAGGKLPKNFNAGEGSTLNVHGGTIGDNFEVHAAVVNINGGSIGNDLDAFANSKINIDGGTIGANVDAYNGSQIVITAGLVGHIDALTGSEVQLSGGRLNRLQASAGSKTTWNGGTLPTLAASTSANINIVGADFRLNGTPLAGLSTPGDALTFDIPENSILTATLTDGTPLILGPYRAQLPEIANGVLKLVRSEDPVSPLPSEYLVIDQSAPYAVGQDQHLVMKSGGQLPDSIIAGKGSSVRIEGGNVLANFKAFETDIVVEGGNIGNNFTALMGTKLDITGGQIGSGFQIHNGAEVDISGGLLPAQVTIDSGAIVNLYGKSFLLGGMPIPELQNIGDSFQLNQFNGQFLTAVLTDGSPLSWRLAQSGSPPSYAVARYQQPGNHHAALGSRATDCDAIALTRLDGLELQEIHDPLSA